MNVRDARKVLKDPRKLLKIIALSYVSLGELEADVIYLRYFLQLTQERAAERVPLLYQERLGLSREDAVEQYSLSVNGLQKIENRALEKCCKAWDRIVFIQDMVKAAQ